LNKLEDRTGQLGEAGWGFCCFGHANLNKSDMGSSPPYVDAHATTVSPLLVNVPKSLLVAVNEGATRLTRCTSVVSNFLLMQLAVRLQKINLS
jgi:hypothetical protein